MPRIPSAIAVVAMLALCIGFNVAYYPAVRRMTPACGLSMPGLGAREAAPAASIPGSGGIEPASPAFCTAGGICFDASGKRLPDKGEAASPESATRQQATEGLPRETAGASRRQAALEGPAETTPAATHAVPAADTLAGNHETADQRWPPAKPDVAALQRGTAGELPLIPAIRRLPPQGSAGVERGAALASAGPLSAPTPLGQEAPAANRVERLPAAEEVAAAGAAAIEPAIPPDAIPIYPTTPVP